MISLLQLLFPNWYRLIWNDEFRKGMERSRKELHQEFPEHTDLVDRRIDEVLERRLIK